MCPELSGQIGSSTACWSFKFHIIFASMCCRLFYVYIQIPLCSWVLVSHSSEISINKTSHSVDTSAGIREESTVMLVFVYANGLAVIFIVSMLFHLILCIAVKFGNALLVFIVSEQALLPPDQKPLGSCGHINQLWPRYVTLIGREAGLQGEGFLHSRCVCLCVCVCVCCLCSSCMSMQV